MRKQVGLSARAGRTPRAYRSETLPVLEQRLAERLLDFETMDAAWPSGRTAIERAEIRRQREDALSEIITLRQRESVTESGNPSGNSTGL